MPSGSKSSFAWSLTAGIGAPLSGSKVVEMAISYVDLGKLQSDAGTIVGNLGTTGSYLGTEGKLKAREFTVGVRF